MSPTPASPASATGGCWRTGSTGRNATVLMTGVMGLGQLGKLIFTYTCMYVPHDLRYVHGMFHLAPSSSS